MAWFDGFCEGIGESMIDTGEQILGAGLKVWKDSAQVVLQWTTQDPSSFGGAWSMVYSLFNMFFGIGASLMTLYFVIGWLRESVDIRSTFNLENMFRIFLRLTLTASLMTNAMSLIRSVMSLAAALAGSIGAKIATNYTASGIFDSLTEGVSGAGYIGVGIVAILVGFIGMLVIIVCGVSILLAVMSRFFKIFICIPFAPVALASFAGGHGLSQSGISWIKTFLAYTLEVLVIAITLVLTYLLFRSVGNLFDGGASGLKGAVLMTVQLCCPMLAAVANVKAAEGTIRKCLGL